MGDGRWEARCRGEQRGRGLTWNGRRRQRCARCHLGQLRRQVGVVCCQDGVERCEEGPGSGWGWGGGAGIGATFEQRGAQAGKSPTRQWSHTVLPLMGAGGTAQENNKEQAVARLCKAQIFSVGVARPRREKAASTHRSPASQGAPSRGAPGWAHWPSAARPGQASGAAGRSGRQRRQPPGPRAHLWRIELFVLLFLFLFLLLSRARQAGDGPGRLSCSSCHFRRCVSARLGLCPLLLPPHLPSQSGPWSEAQITQNEAHRLRSGTRRLFSQSRLAAWPSAAAAQPQRSFSSSGVCALLAYRQPASRRARGRGKRGWRGAAPPARPPRAQSQRRRRAAPRHPRWQRRGQ